MNENIKNVRGFTLVELLAVIVVLAIVMLIAVNAVLPQMEKARRQSLAIEANAVIDSAQLYFMSSGLTGTTGFPANDGGTNCVEIDYLINNGFSELDVDDYDGKVVVQKKGEIYLYYVFLNKQNTWMIRGAGTDIDFGGTYSGSKNESITENDVDDYDSAVAGTSTDFATCPSTSTSG